MTPNGRYGLPPMVWARVGGSDPGRSFSMESNNSVWPNGLDRVSPACETRFVWVGVWTRTTAFGRKEAIGVALSRWTRTTAFGREDSIGVTLSCWTRTTAFGRMDSIMVRLLVGVAFSQWSRATAFGRKDSIGLALSWLAASRRKQLPLVARARLGRRVRLARTFRLAVPRATSCHGTLGRDWVDWSD